MKKHILTLILLIAALGVAAQDFVMRNEMRPIPYAGEPPSNAEFSVTGNWAVIDIFAVAADEMDYKGDIVVEKKKITGGCRLYVYVPKADKEILIVKDGVMPFHLQIPNGTLISKKLYRVELEMSGGVQPTQQSTTGTTAGHEWVDLGLPSGTRWATCNVGASNPEDYGEYFAWGETTTKSTFSWDNYKHGNGRKDDVSKKYNIYDRKTTLEKSDDVAYQQWGRDWCMPTEAQFQELYDNCKTRWTSNYQDKGVAGTIFKSKKNDNTIFFPAAGMKSDMVFGVSGKNSSGLYWSSIISAHEPFLARVILIGSKLMVTGDASRLCGCTVRPVRCNN